VDYDAEVCGRAASRNTMAPFARRGQGIYYGSQKRFSSIPPPLSFGPSASSPPRPHWILGTCSPALVGRVRKQARMIGEHLSYVKKEANYPQERGSTAHLQSGDHQAILRQGPNEGHPRRAMGADQEGE
jgi:hypothetical protein